MSAVPQTIDAALGHHRAGRLAEAETIYRQILQADPKHVDALHLLGVLAHQVGQNETAGQLISQAINFGAGAQAYNNLGNVHRAMNNIPAAAASYAKAIELQPDYAEPHTNLGLLLEKSGRLDDARVHHRRAIQLSPNLADAHHNLAMTLQRMGKLDDAIAAWERALDIQPDHLHALNNFGLALTSKSTSFDRAASLLRRYVQLMPNDPEGWANLSTALGKLNRTTEALAAAQKVVELAPDRAESHSNVGAVLQKVGKLDEAVAQFRRALEINPDFGIARGNLGSAFEQLGRFEDAAVEFERAAKVLPKYPLVHNTLSALYRNMNRDEESLAAADRSLALDPNQPDAHGNRAFALLSIGNLIDGFYEYEWRWRCYNFTTPPREFDRPMWDGSDPAGRTILVHTEQGYGDVIQMARYLPLLARMGAKVYVECFPPLKALLENVQGVSRVIGAGLKLPDFDLHCPVMSLPRAFRTTLETIPTNVPYLTAPESRRAIWKKRIADASGDRFKVGLTWGGNLKPDPKRTCDFKYLAPLAQVEGVAYISLQTGPPAKQLEDAPQGMSIHHVGDDLKDFADTAAVLECLDLMICIDTGVVHLAGAIGVKTWTMLPFSPDWRWLRDREDNPWYPTMRLFRQPTRGDWASVVARIVEELNQLVPNKGSWTL